mgnify:CR=1 FL=1
MPTGPQPIQTAGNATANWPIVLAGTYPVFVEMPAAGFPPEPRRDWAGSDPL